MGNHPYGTGSYGGETEQACVLATFNGAVEGDPSVAFVGVLKVRLTVTEYVLLGSFNVVTLKFCEVVPGEKVNVPLAGV